MPEKQKGAKAPDLSNVKKDAEKRMHEEFAKIQYHCAQIYHLMQPGLTVELDIPKSKIIIPGKKPNAAGKLYIMKPAAGVYMGDDEKEMSEVNKKIKHYCEQIFDLMPSGVTAELDIKESEIVVPGKMPRIAGKLYVTKPAGGVVMTMECETRAVDIKKK